MPTDAYVKFGTTKDTCGTKKTPLPLIAGDCTDETHYWWCELRDCGFGLTFPDQEKAGEGDGKKKEKLTVQLEKVSLKKRVDWASTQLFLKCCEAGKAKIAKSKAEQDKGKIDRVTVELCRSADDEKFPLAWIEYSAVRVISYSIDMSEPEPVETIEFECDSFEFGYQETNPFDGSKKGSMSKTTPIEGRDNSTGGATSDGAAPTDAATPTGDSGVTAGTGNAIGATGNNSSLPGLASAADAAVSVNFPGLWGATGFGVLPD